MNVVARIWKQRSYEGLCEPDALLNTSAQPMQDRCSTENKTTDTISFTRIRYSLNARQLTGVSEDSN